MEKASYVKHPMYLQTVKDCVCRSPEAGKVGTGRPQEGEKHTGKVEGGGWRESAEPALCADPVLSAGNGKSRLEQLSRGHAL